MLEVKKPATEPGPLKPIVIFGVLGLVLALRLAHLSSALISPLSYLDAVFKVAGVSLFIIYALQCLLEGDSHIALEQPDNGPILEALGFTAIKRMDFAEAAQDYKRANAARPRSHVAHYNLATVYLQLGNRARALEEAKAAADLNPSADYLGLVGQVEAAP
jgi:tetratricopeptide (TPR) repeat protein